ncbi:hypothetical protein FEM33_02775 [Dyadobacter flavalbus]|uniref:DUF4465 domain-containing protein n=1 Tax=Dyadobacter flavalbus TaxID=2579942 RepID=A0A5M8R1R1_9BACT|nr:hypothetical protein [Dyadobacter flavalbus]KAA6441250.1 hypothetical protein FEM33_02775 [Dyadobacter flavalbus]
MVQITKSLSFMASAACLSTMLFMSSCSKEDAVTPSPEATIASVQGVNLREYNPLISVQKIHPTIGQLGLGSLPSGYTLTGSNMTAGLSNATYLFGNSAQPWIPATNSLPDLLGQNGTFLTLGATKDNLSGVHVKIKNIFEGKTYKFTYYVSTMAVKYSSGPGQTPYASSFIFSYIAPVSGNNYSLSLAGKENQWIANSIELNGNSSTIGDLVIKLLGKNSNATSYGNIFIPVNAIQEVK